MSTAREVQDALAAVANRDDARDLQRFFKTGKGQYGAGDVFIGVKVPEIRRIAQGFADLSPADLNDLLDSSVHEHRFAALAIMVGQFAAASKAGDEGERERLVQFYLSAMRRGRINNWDLVDSSAEYILGEYLFDKPRDQLPRLAKSGVIWQRRIAIIATFAFIKRGDASTTLEVAEILLPDQHDLIQKAVGWMLREVGKRVDRDLLVEFITTHAKVMSRVTLNYATEHFENSERVYYRSL
ncbi:3-methyladenine DNA glycosylase AlkD [Conyzicola nivalis]|uniref:3-methyladenine DNA glycosylase AlkD n=1 Tax=Conyzicola nivalis TaxID=1477021 RepID=A0ABV2QTV2_9MICO